MALSQMSLFAFLAVGAVALFTFLAVAVYAEHRVKERTSYHKYDTLKKLAEGSKESAERVLEVMREEERVRRRKMIEGIKLGGLITCAVGVAVGVFLYLIIEGDQPPVHWVGLIPLAVGIVMLVYATTMVPKSE